MLIYERRIVGEVLGFALCSDPAWDMLLDLYSAQQSGRAVYLSALWAAGNIPSSSAHRWTTIMAAQGLLIRHSDLKDRRRVQVRLSDSMVGALDTLMDQLIGRIDLAAGDEAKYG